MDLHKLIFAGFYLKVDLTSYCSGVAPLKPDTNVNPSIKAKRGLLSADLVTTDMVGWILIRPARVQMKGITDFFNHITQTQ